MTVPWRRGRRASYHCQTSLTRFTPHKRILERREGSIFLFLFLADGSSSQTIDRTLCLHLGRSSWNQNLQLRFEENFKLCLWIAKKKRLQDEVSKPQEIKLKHAPPNHTTSGKMSLGISPVLNAVCLCVCSGERRLK